MKRTLRVASAGVLLSVLASFSFALSGAKTAPQNVITDRPVMNYSQPAEIVNPFALGKREGAPIMLAQSTGSCGGTLTTPGGSSCTCPSTQRPVVSGENCSCKNDSVCQ